MNAAEDALQILSYAVTFGLFALFVFASKTLVGDAESPPDGSGWCFWLAWKCSSENQGAPYKHLATRASTEEADEREEELLQPQAAVQADAAIRIGRWGCAQREREQAMQLIFCMAGIQISFILWGIMQETIMTSTYSAGKFTSTKFLVFANQVIALLLGTAIAWWQEAHGQVSVTLPLYRFSFCSATNILSSASQLEALKYVSFPLQVLSKGCKMIPVMVMGKLVADKAYKAADYVEALLITSGVVSFKLSEKEDIGGPDTQVLGVLLLIIYMFLDAFTSNWQHRLFDSGDISPFQMMARVNLFSVIFTFCGLLLTMEIVGVIEFVCKDSRVIMHIATMSICNAVGQSFIYHTIKTFGPLVFVTITTVRQLFSIAISFALFSHPINSGQCLGIALVFVTIAASICRKMRAQRAKRHVSLASNNCETVLAMPQPCSTMKTPGNCGV
mmetsp:Transcript_8865/g.14849  ORF Transcript_8865/g.14849 Transcript_8865/m.14849 type:complete len:446 (+) Transcript_8865:26-1363(+)|eukprot:CAMPEP_0119312952 /NCGR_PEP_ID=MMETSP1333-20130426/27363_1 /TAXON_ID=418940 /ORGANISM="Scyphosphaera apsteinii, Strain RCC1455" /LENGTH=445 /DNA_ID=CAMNT_0007317659 /DNA_START=26 /DNA_END=1363 /DNA_ORIENTATION=+